MTYQDSGGLSSDGNSLQNGIMMRFLSQVLLRRGVGRLLVNVDACLSTVAVNLTGWHNSWLFVVIAQVLK